MPMHRHSILPKQTCILGPGIILFTIKTIRDTPSANTRSDNRRESNNIKRTKITERCFTKERYGIVQVFKSSKKLKIYFIQKSR